MNKRILGLVLLVALLIATVAFAAQPAPAVDPTFVHPDGTYRGGYIDPAQVEVQFKLEAGKFTEVRFRALGYRGDDYLKTEDPKLLEIAKQYQDLADYLVGKEVSALQDLYHPAEITKDADTFTAATLRSSKLISLINDGLNRGLYALPAE